ncbi:hypothetical protein [Pseudonocardia sp. ICBG1034]|uniref:hypothetical protein n=1 Tax=Pseudonocardia sp. ICBG1034 TaxID=2844381 RepID=UPI001CCE4CFB|nr:hypothetical protein [Pseudonocardia sp. ICBG1034]
MTAAVQAELNDDRETAAMLVRRCADDVAAVLPEALPDWAWVAGRCAGHDPALGDARTLLRMAEHGFREQDRPIDAAFACAALAELPDTPIDEALALWAESADLVARSEYTADDGTADWIRGCVEEAAAAAAQAVAALRVHGDEARAAELVGAAHALSHRHGPDDLTGQLGALATHLACGAGLPVAEALPRFATARVLLGLPGPGNRIDLARVDLFEARALLTAYRLTEAESLLHAALPELRMSGSRDEIEGAEAMLLAVGAAGDGTAVPGAQVGSPERWSIPELRAGALALQAVAALADGRVDDAAEQFERAASTAAGDGLAARAATFAGLAALVRLADHGDRPGALRSIAELERLRDDPRTAAVDDVVRVAFTLAQLRGAIAYLAGDRQERRDRLAELEDELLGLGAGLLAARIALDRARDLLDDDPGGALQTALPAALAVDSLRFMMPDAGRRRRWAGVAAAGFDTSFRAAVACGRPRLVAELLEVVRGHAIPVALADPDEGGPGDLARTLADLADVTAPPASAPTTMAQDTTLSGAAVVAAAGNPGRTGLGLPAQLRTPWSGPAGGHALADALDDARHYSHPLRADAVAHWRPRAAGHGQREGGT